MIPPANYFAFQPPQFCDWKYLSLALIVTMVGPLPLAMMLSSSPLALLSRAQ